MLETREVVVRRASKKRSSHSRSEAGRKVANRRSFINGAGMHAAKVSVIEMRFLSAPCFLETTIEFPNQSINVTETGSEWENAPGSKI